MKNTIFLTIMMLITTPLFAQMSPTYQHFDIGYENTKRSGETELTGIGLGGVFAIDENHHIVGAYGDVDQDFRETRMAVLMYGYRYPYEIAGGLDIYARIGLAWQQTLYPTVVPVTITDTGYAISVGARKMVTYNFEVSGWLGSHRTHSTRGTISLESVYFFIPGFGAYASVDFGGTEGRNIRLGGRIRFD